MGGGFSLGGDMRISQKDIEAAERKLARLKAREHTALEAARKARERIEAIDAEAEARKAGRYKVIDRYKESVTAREQAEKTLDWLKTKP
jgi:hypothetical protein